MREEVLAGTFFLNENPIIILFDSRVSHDFMSSTCAKKEKLSLVASGAPYVNSTPRGWVDADQIVQKVLLELSRRIFSTNLIILSGQGINVILRMSWMNMQRAVLDIAGWLVHLDSPVYGESASRPLVGFGVLNDNLIKCLISFIEVHEQILSNRYKSIHGYITRSTIMMQMELSDQCV
jgi:hypothetical protein